MREVLVAANVRERIDELDQYLQNELKFSKEAARKRCDRFDQFFRHLVAPISHPLCRLERWRRLGYRCAVFERDWVLAYEVLPEGVIVREIESSRELIK